MTIALAVLLLPATAHASVSCINGGFGIKYCRVTAQRNRDSGTFVVTRRFRANAK
jgi:hypothetical protein